MRWRSSPQLAEHLVNVVLEPTEGGLEELARLLVPALARTLVDPAHPAHHAARLALLARSVQPLQQFFKLFLAVHAPAFALDPRLDLFVDEREQERVVSIEEGNQGGQGARVYVGSRLSRVFEREEGAKEGLEGGGESRREDEVEG